MTETWLTAAIAGGVAAACSGILGLVDVGEHHPVRRIWDMLNGPALRLFVRFDSAKISPGASLTFMACSYFAVAFLQWFIIAFLLFIVLRTGHAPLD